MDIFAFAAVISTISGFIAIFIRLRQEWNKKKRELRKEAIKTLSSEAKKFIVKSEELLTYPDEVKNNTVKIWKKARKYVKMVSLTALPGLPWAPSENIIQNKKKKNVEIKIILLHPEAIDFLAEMEASFSEGPDFVNLSPEAVRTEFMKQLKESVPKLVEIIGKDNVRFYKKPFFWKGTIVDGRYAQYVFTIFQEGPYLLGILKMDE